MRAKEVQKTIKYAALFNASLTLKELHSWLISSQKYSLKELSSFLSKHPQLQKKLILKNNPTRLKKIHLTQKKMENIQKLVFALKLIPTIKLVALTGSLSVYNPQKDDDIDLMIITTPNTLWLTRPLIVFIVSFLSKRRKPGSSLTNNQVCLNLWLDQAGLTVPKNKQNLYTAHEVLQIKPLFDRGGIHHQFILANSWVKKYLANAYSLILTKDKFTTSLVTNHHRHNSDSVFKQSSVKIISTLNSFAFKLQYLYMKKKITNEYVTLHAAYFHPRSLYPQIKKHLF